jgi:hypothetical protein
MSIELPELIAADPISRPAVTYDRYWLQTLVMQAPSPTQKATATVILAPYSQADGSLLGQTVTLAVDDLFARAATDAQLAGAMAALVAAVQRLAADQGIVAAATP